MTDQSPYAARLDALRRQLLAEGLEGFLTFEPANRRYLTGFTGTSGYALITSDQAWFFTDARYVEQAQKECPLVEVVRHREGVWSTVAEHLEAAKLARIGFEKAHVSVSTHEKLAAHCPQVTWVATEQLVERLRMRKDEAEIETIRRAQAVLEKAFAATIPQIAPGMSERDVAVAFHVAALQAGADGLAFPSIVASGPRAALPHGIASHRVIGTGEWLTLDVGCVVDGYASDMTRTFVVGEATPRQRDVYNLVLQAQKAGLAAVAPGKTGRQVDEAARAIIRDGGYGEYFGHGLGHGLGLDVHEGPRLSPTGAQVLEAGMVVTVEPGVYIPGWGGVRIEDLVVVREGGAENLTGVSKVFHQIDGPGRDGN